MHGLETIIRLNNAAAARELARFPGSREALEEAYWKAANAVLNAPNDEERRAARRRLDDATAAYYGVRQNH